MRQKITLAVAALLAVPALAACGGNADSGSSTVAEDCKPKHQFSTVQEGVLTVSSFDLPPFSKFEGTELTGVDADILAEIAEMECLTIEAQPMDTANVIPAAQNGRVDVAAGDWYRTADRAAVVSLSAPLYVDQMGIISADGIADIPQLKGKTVGTVDGYLWVEDMQKYLGPDLKTYQSSTAMWQDLMNGRIDVATDSYAAATYTNEQNDAGMKIEVAKPFRPVAASTEAAQSSFPISKQNPQLLAAVNADIQELHKNGTIKQILTDHGLEASAGDTGAPRLIK